MGELNEQIFISYRRSETLEIAATYNENLSSSGYVVFFDKDKKHGVKNGNFYNILEQHIKNTTDFLVFVTPGSFTEYAGDKTEDDVYLKEIRWAIEYEKNIIPVFCKFASGRYADQIKDIPADIAPFILKNNGLESGEKFHENLPFLKDVLLDSVKNTGKVTGDNLRPGSEGYVSTNYAEDKRLRIQSRFTRALDANLIKSAKKQLGRSSGLSVLDLGCGKGHVTMDRFTRKAGFSVVVGLDYNEKAIADAAGRADSLYSFAVADLEKDDAETTLCEIMESRGIEAFDIIYSSFTLHHVKDPVKTLERFKKYLAPDGVCILVGIDDGAQISYAYNKETGAPDEKKTTLVERNTELTVKTRGISGRYTGRQFYAWMKNAGFSNIKMCYDIYDTVDKTPDEREDLYTYYFSFRKDYTSRALEKYPDDPEIKALHKSMLENLNDIRRVLIDDDDYYYMLVIFGVTGRK